MPHRTERTRQRHNSDTTRTRTTLRTSAHRAPPDPPHRIALQNGSRHLHTPLVTPLLSAALLHNAQVCVLRCSQTHGAQLFSELSSGCRPNAHCVRAHICRAHHNASRPPRAAYHLDTSDECLNQLLECSLCTCRSGPTGWFGAHRGFVEGADGNMVAKFGGGGGGGSIFGGGLNDANGLPTSTGAQVESTGPAVLNALCIWLLSCCERR